MSQQIKESTRYQFLDALRGLAILGVISTHCAWFAGNSFRGRPFALAGMYGVQLFFMVSAYTIFLTLERAQARDTAVVTGFYIRRMLRILPMFWVGIILYAFAPGREHYYDHFNFDYTYYLLTAVLQQGWHPYYINSIVPGSWSIAIEVTFYIVTPILFFRIRNWRRALSFLLFSLILASAANNLLRVAVDRQWIFTNIQPHELLLQFGSKWFPSQLPVFACGILTYFVVKSLPETFRTKRNGLLLLATSMFILYNAVDIGSHRLIPEQLVFALGFFPLIVALAIDPTKIIVNPVICFLGRISYSFYLMHFVVMAAEVMLAKAYFQAVYAKPVLAFFLFFAATLLFATPIAWFTYRFVEQPFIRLGASIVGRIDSFAEKPAKTPAILTPTAEP